MPIQIQWHQNDADPHADPTPIFSLVGKSELLFLVTELEFNMFISIFISE
jgi:hypothetical protein